MSLLTKSACLTLFATASLGLSSQFALADGNSCHVDLNVKFVESAPRDRFVISNNSTTNVEIISASIDLSTSQGNLIFDTEDGGTGVEVFQKFRSETDQVKLVASPEVNDGDNQLDMSFNWICPSKRSRKTKFINLASMLMIKMYNQILAKYA